MPALNPTSASLLGLLADHGPLTGADLVRVAQTRVGDFWNLTRSQVYRELAGLAEAGHVEAGTPGARDAQPYRVTPQGAQTLDDWLAVADPRETTRIGLLLLVAFGRRLPPGRLAAVLDAYEAEHRERLAGYEALEATLVAEGENAFTRATLAFGLHYERAVLAWLADLPDEVRERGARALTGPALASRQAARRRGDATTPASSAGDSVPRPRPSSTSPS